MLDEMSSENDGSNTHLNNMKTHSIHSRNSGIDDALKLLTSWDLPELHRIFKEQEISVRALRYLKDDEINELIPKIGPRTIFRAMLSEWREELGFSLVSSEQTAPVAPTPKISQAPKRKHNDAFPATEQIPIELDSAQDDPIATKTETADIDESGLWLEEERTISEEDDSLQEAVDNFYKSSSSLATSKKVQREFSDSREYTEERFNVHLLLSNRKDGQAALDYYKQNDCLDLKNRKRVVKIIIFAIVERRIEKYTALFDDITNQILKLFPNEKYESYYVPHSGTKPARGALYYKYSNYTRQLRKEGLMEYKVNKYKHESFDSQDSIKFSSRSAKNK